MVFIKGNPVLMGSVSSGVSEDKGDSTKKRRVERSRKYLLMFAIAIGSYSLLIRDSYWNSRKDSEQTKQIEELQKENEDLKDEKRRLVEEIERIYPESGSW
ncbi:hypothetical protein GW17_00001209 [Ensete ventricosum]|nr:hypothetical protein GW17_00001209 [Ensete ventricosum]RZS13190.1 hypothetical protein BHM03_00044739 [Ensete ventricosum]